MIFMAYVDPYEAFQLRMKKRIQRVIAFREANPDATIDEISKATGYLPSSIRLWLNENDTDDEQRKEERREELKAKIYGS